MGRGGHAGCNRTRVAWAGGTVAALGSAWLLKAAVDFTLVIILYGMLGMLAYSKRELLSSYCRPPGAHEGRRPSGPTCAPASLHVSCTQRSSGTERRLCTTQALTGFRTPWFQGWTTTTTSGLNRLRHRRLRRRRKDVSLWMPFPCAA